MSPGPVPYHLGCVLALVRVSESPETPVGPAASCEGIVRVDSYVAQCGVGGESPVTGLIRVTGPLVVRAVRRVSTPAGSLARPGRGRTVTEAHEQWTELGTGCQSVDYGHSSCAAVLLSARAVLMSLFFELGGPVARPSNRAEDSEEEVLRTRVTHGLGSALGVFRSSEWPIRAWPRFPRVWCDRVETTVEGSGPEDRGLWRLRWASCRAPPSGCT